MHDSMDPEKRGKRLIVCGFLCIADTLEFYQDKDPGRLIHIVFRGLDPAFHRSNEIEV
jgi:hypothetical protein